VVRRGGLGLVVGRGRGARGRQAGHQGRQGQHGHETSRSRLHASSPRTTAPSGASPRWDKRKLPCFPDSDPSVDGPCPAGCRRGLSHTTGRHATRAPGSPEPGLMPTDPTPPPPRLRPRLLLAGLLAAAVAAFYALGLHRYLSWDYVRGHLDELRAWADD